MKLVLSEGSQSDPGILLNAAKAWEELYLHTVELGHTTNIIAGIYCLFVAVEMYLKAYIVAQDKRYAEPAKLKELEHNYNKMYQQVLRVAPKEFANDIKVALNKHGLFELNINKLKYPAAPQFWSVDDGIHKGEHAFKSIFGVIAAEVANKKIEWVNQKKSIPGISCVL